MKLNRQQLLIAYNLPAALWHEGCHYWVARALGLKARIHLFYTYVEDEEARNWKAVIVILGPAMINTIVWLAANIIWFVLELPTCLVPAISTWWYSMSQLRCFSDVEAVWHFWRQGSWPQWLAEPSTPENLQTLDGRFWAWLQKCRVK